MIGNKQSTEAAGLGAGNWVLKIEIVRGPLSVVRCNATDHGPLTTDSRLELPVSSSQAVEERRMQR